MSPTRLNSITNNDFLLSNVRLETGFVYDEQQQVIATQTAIFDIIVTNGIIQQITKKAAISSAGLPNNSNDDLRKHSNNVDANGLLMLPTFQDMHIHIDKTYYGGAWQAAPWTGSIKDMISLEEKLILSYYLTRNTELNLLSS